MEKDNNNDNHKVCPNHAVACNHCFPNASRPGEAPPNELVELANAILAASFGGFLFGGFVGARHAGDRFILMNSNAKFSSTMQAQVGNEFSGVERVYTCTVQRVVGGYVRDMFCTVRTTVHVNSI